MDRDSNNSSNSNGLGKLLPKSITAKRRRKKTEGPPSHDDDDDRGRSMKSRETLESDGTTSTTNMADDERSKSFQSYDSDEPSSRPGVVSAHPSQIGYLTTSSPIVQATHLSESVTDLDSNSSEKSSTFPTQRSDSVESKESYRLGRSKTGLLPPHNPSRRSTSPGAKFKGIFRPKRSPVDNNSPERRQSIEYPPPRRSSTQQPTTIADSEPPLIPPIIEPPAAAKVASPDRRSRVQPRVDTNLPPRTPPSGDKPAPVIVNTPPTPVDVSYGSAQSSPERKTFWGVSSPNSSANGNSPSRAMSVHRRSRSGSVNIGPSKLSNIVAPPLSPAIESGEPTPNANTGSGFFSSMITVAQNAASTLSNNIQNTSINLGANKKGNPTPRVPDQDTSSEPEVTIEPAPAAQLDNKMEQKGSAVRTLGTGELSLSQLGLAEPSSTVASPKSPRFPDVTDTRARSESAPVDVGASPVELLPEDSQSRPRSLYEPPSGDRTPPPPPDYTDSKTAMQRTSSLRSALKQPHRKRGSSVTTGTTIGAAIAAASTSLAHPNLSAPKLTGFAIASKKRNRDFHDFFKSVPDDDYLIEDYSCALQREILAHGRLYVSEGHLCFSSNILGWTTTLVMSFDEIVSVEKRSTALVFKNGLMISTLHAKHVFASFTSRDATYDLIVNIWKLGHPTLKSTLNGVRLEGTGGDKTEKVDTDLAGLDEEGEDGSETDDDSDEEEEEYYDEDIHDEIHASLAEANGADADADPAVSRKASGVSPTNGAALTDAAATPGSSGDFPGPAVHLPTECGDVSTHYDRIVGDEVIPAPLGKVYSLIFGQASPKFMSNWLTGDQKCTELQMEDQKGLSLENRTRTFSYIKPLNAPIGPRQTKCIVTETLDILDYERAANLSVSTQTPDVPSGNVFCVKTRYCLSWAENNATRVQMNCTIEWSGKSWLKGPIEKGANDGQATFSRDLFAALKAAVSTRPAPPPALVTGARVKRKGKSKKSAQLAPGVVEVAPKRVEQKTWGMLEPIRGLLEPLGDILKPLLTGNVMYGLLVGLLVTTWFGVGLTPRKNSPSIGQEMGMYQPYRMAAYEEMWRREDGELWEWLEERVGLDRLNSDRLSPRQKAVEPRTVEEKLKVARMNEREVEEAIRITEEKLQILKGVVGKKEKAGSGASEEIPKEGR